MKIFSRPEKRKQPKRIIGILFLCILFVMATFMLTSCKLWTVVKIEDVGTEQDKIDDINAYVDSLWESKIIPYLDERAADSNVLLPGIEANLDKTANEYGNRTSESNPWQFVLKGTGSITKINKDTQNRTIQIDIPNIGNDADLLIQIGPVIEGSSLRDTLAFIKFDDYNQITFYALNDALNNKVVLDIIGEQGFTEGQEVSFTGTFGISKSSDPIVLTPVDIHIEGGGQ